jgi:GntP family gluconate:H+ symporter
MTHSLVPPTPGPLFVASALNVDVGVMIIGGIVIGAITTSAGLGYAFFANRKWPWAMDASVTGDTVFAERPASALPPLGAALLPIVIAVGLIAGHAIARAIDPDSGLTRALGAIGHPIIALALAAMAALLVLARAQRGRRGAVQQGVQRALADAGMIILITAAGGVFGGMLQETGVGLRIEGLARELQIAVLPLAFAVTALVRTAQGSATVAMITAVGMFGGLAAPETLGCHPVYLALAIGCGSKLVPWMNDSGFWVVCRMSGFSEVQMLRTFSAALTLMGTVGLAAILLLARFLPLV